MSRTCMVTGATPGFGHRISHSHRRTKRRFDVNVQQRRYWVPSLTKEPAGRADPVTPTLELGP